ncbi:hypothetical protein [Xanthobacter versatilis]|uniref:hypothetical protein n=1 Tax=Xanthobacter autotrophicus (strain ATCC BAA-1158 / Py2) TaxID=78245 RepID=UPI00372C586E
MVPQRWREEFVVLGRARISVEQIMGWARPRKTEIDRIEVQFEKAARAVALKRQKARSHLRFFHHQCCVVV